jgi:hypothetical protein
MEVGSGKRLQTSSQGCGKKAAGRGKRLVFELVVESFAPARRICEVIDLRACKDIR